MSTQHDGQNGNTAQSAGEGKVCGQCRFLTKASNLHPGWVFPTVCAKYVVRYERGDKACDAFDGSR